MYYIDKKFLGTPHHLIYREGNFVPINLPPDNSLVEDGTTDPGTLQSFLQISNNQNFLIPDNILKTLLTCGIPKEQAGLSYLIRDKELSKLLVKFQQGVEPQLSQSMNYIGTYIKNIKTLNACSPMKFFKQAPNVKMCSSGFTEPVVYDTTTTKTGRMSVVSGPNVLTLQKNFKKNLKSRFEAGKIVEIDYSALEPRVALAVAGSEIAQCEDLYSTIGQMIKISDRAVVKQLVISFLYGAGMSTMQKLTNLSFKNLKVQLDKVKKLFQQDQLIQRLKSELAITGSFQNHAGRVVFPGSDKNGIIFNNYCQSTAVDVALSGFSNLLKDIQDLRLETVPLCFIHDAILLDIPAKELESVKQLALKLHTYLGISFPAKFTIIND